MALRVQFVKEKDGSVLLRCLRADGTTTWQRQEGAQAAFFPRHDLTHYAVETVLGHRQGFYGLVATGWDLSDFGNPWPRGRLPADAGLSEMIVGFLDLERGTGQIGMAEDLNETLSRYCSENSLPPAVITDDDLNRVRQKRGELFTRWEAVKPGDALELPFSPDA